jgi:hypothetical protein
MGRSIKSDAIDSRRCENWLRFGATDKKNKKFFSQPYIFRFPVIYPVMGFSSTTE